MWGKPLVLLCTTADVRAFVCAVCMPTLSVRCVCLLACLLACLGSLTVARTVIVFLASVGEMVIPFFIGEAMKADTLWMTRICVAAAVAMVATYVLALGMLRRDSHAAVLAKERGEAGGSEAAAATAGGGLKATAAAGGGALGFDMTPVVEPQ